MARPTTQTSQPPIAAAADEPNNQRTSRAIRLLVLLGVAVLFSHHTVDPDLWGHIRYGQDWIADGTLPRTATHTFTAEGYRWINHENLAELCMAFAFDHWGVQSLILAKCLIGVALVALCFRLACRRGVHVLASSLTLVLAARAMAEFWAVRPQMATFLGFATLLLIFEGASHVDATGQRRRGVLALGPLLMCAWGNAHGGFVAGVCILGAWCGLEAAQAVYRDGRRGWRDATILSCAAAAGALATLLNPYGWKLHLWLLQALGQTRPEISEWASILSTTSDVWPFATLTVLAVAAVSLSSRERNLTQLVILALTWWQAARHVRHIPFFAMACAFWLPVHVESAAARLRAWLPQRQRTRRDSPASKALLGLEYVGLVAVLLTCCIRNVRDVPVMKNQYPVSALQYMNDHGLQGRLVVYFDWAQYALAALAPHTSVAFDGRLDTCYPANVIDMHFDLMLGDMAGRRYRDAQSGPCDPTHVLSYCEPDLVLVSRQPGIPAPRVMASQADWSLLYQDAIAQLWGRKAKYDEPSSPDYLAASARAISEARQHGSAPFPAYPVSAATSLPVSTSPPAASRFPADVH